ncbi:hypothetical protein DPMN_095244 [Dreissena polymorpha]|uniref:Uncharacterized protein n=1 Tax=Dreissena polymorpha TaxID=45954 RepID=A0A9D4L7I5_DREPO|nr:hypothetical protein DPMN_095244 [Dreissena polymorpha]
MVYVIRYIDGDVTTLLSLRPMCSQCCNQCFATTFDDDVEAARQAAVDTATKFAGTAILDGKETELFVPSEHVPDGIPVTVYTPEVCRQQGRLLQSWFTFMEVGT